MLRHAWLITVLTMLCIAAAPATRPTVDDGRAYVLSAAQLAGGAHHVRHAEFFGRGVEGINLFVLRAIDQVQASAPDGGGYFTGVKATPAESPIGYRLELFGRPMLQPPRTTSYCSGSTYSAF